MAAKAAMQGMYSKVKVKKAKALRGVNIANKAWESSISETAPVKTVKVLTTASLAVNPVIRAVDALQSLKPKGMNMGATMEPK